MPSPTHLVATSSGCVKSFRSYSPGLGSQKASASALCDEKENKKCHQSFLCGENEGKRSFVFVPDRLLLLGVSSFRGRVRTLTTSTFPVECPSSFREHILLFCKTHYALPPHTVSETVQSKAGLCGTRARTVSFRLGFPRDAPNDPYWPPLSRDSLQRATAGRLFSLLFSRHNIATTDVHRLATTSFA